MANNHLDMLNDLLEWIGTIDGHEYVNTNHPRLWQVLYDEGFNDTQGDLDVVNLPRRFREILNVVLQRALRSGAFHPGMLNGDDRALQEIPAANVARQVRMYQHQVAQQARIDQAVRIQVPVLRLRDDASGLNAGPVEEDVPNVMEAAGIALGADMEQEGAETDEDGGPVVEGDNVAGNDGPGAHGVTESTGMEGGAGSPRDSENSQGPPKKPRVM